MNYEFKTTFWTDFSIADIFGVSAIKDTYKRAFEEWKDDVVYLTELVLVLNWKIWQHYEKGHHTVAKVYDRLWSEAQSYAYETLKGEDLSYFFNVID